MKNIFIILLACSFVSCNSQNKNTEQVKSTSKKDTMDFKIVKTDEEWKAQLSPEAYTVLREKGTERPYTGEYDKHFEKGMYVCAGCENPLFTSDTKFDSHCGWPSFDDEIKGSVTRILDADGRRTEIVCNNCQGHLGHVFLGEQMTDKNTRHCVNTSSILFVPKDKTKALPEVIK